MSLTDNVVTRETPIRLAKPKWRIIIADTCAEFGIPPETLLAPYGPRRYVPARVTLARRLAAAGYGYAQIGRWLHRDHATVLWYCGRKKGHNMGQVVNGGLAPIPPPVSQFVEAAKRRKSLLPWLSTWITARALATVTGHEYKPIHADLRAMARDGLVVRGGEDRPVRLEASMTDNPKDWNDPVTYLRDQLDGARANIRSAAEDIARAQTRQADAVKRAEAFEAAIARLTA